MPRTRALRLSEFLPYRLSVLSNTVSQRIAEHYEREFGLTVRQWRIMAVLGEASGLTAVEITERTAMDKVAVSRAVAALIDLGYIRREAAQDDGRRSRIFLTRVGDDVYRRIVPLAASYEGELTGAISSEDLALFKQLLDTFAGVVSPDRKLW